MAMVSISHSLSFNPLRRQSSLSPPQGFGIRRRLGGRRWLNCCPLSISCRTVNLKSRCSITNSDVQCGQILADDEIEEQVSVVEPDCSAPIVHINSDILEAEPLTLLADVDSLLTLLPVLSEEEQKALAATPAHPVGLYSLYATCLAGCLVEQLWNFAWPSAIALIHPSLLPVAVMGFFTKLAIIIGGPLIGKLMDYSPRVPSSICLNTVQVAAQLLSAAMIIHAHTVSPTISASSILVRPWFLVLVVAGAIDRLCGLAIGVAMERDWVVLLAGINRPIALAQANAILNRIDLLCEIAGASLFAILLSNYNPVTCLKFAVGLMIWSLPVMIGLTLLTNKLSSGVLDQTRSCHTSCRESAIDDVDNIMDRGLETIKLGWKEYMQQPVLPASLAYVLLYFNVVLAPSSLMTAFLTQRGVNPSIIGGFSGLCASMGVAATFLTATLVRHLGILKAGAAGLVFQASLLALAVAVYWSGSLSQQSPVLLFLGLIVLSRLGHMSYDVVSAQILQTGIPSSKANLIGGTEVSVASLAESVMLGVAIVANDVSHFGFLATLSLLSVVAAAWMFCQWLSNPTDEQRTLFSYEPKI